ncbi:MAG TPA: terminase small subunit [Gammaproteobacteria bacterium]|nr:terminase small subunit [Gammaproteobacteria bacterium]MCH77139.1 terminase small subunit [Gammaproteobacteria bacterium]
MARPTLKGLNDGMRRFAIEYLKDSNATQAAIRAGYAEDSAGQQGHRLLKNEQIRAWLDARLEDAEAVAQFTAERTLRELARVAFADARDLFHEDGRPKAINEIDDDTAACISGVEVVEQYEGSGENREFTGYLKKYRLAEKNAALTNALKYHGLIRERTEVTGKDGGAIQTEDVSKNERARRVAFMLLDALRGKHKDK